MIAASFDVRLTLQGPVLTQSTTQGQFGVDAVMARSGGQFYLPGSLLKGLIGEAWQELASVAPDSMKEAFEMARKRWLGTGSETQNLPARGALFFEDLTDPETPVNGSRTQYRIKIDEERGSVVHGQYLVTEAPYRSGEPATFDGTLRVLSPDLMQAHEARERVQTALRWITAVGAERTVGFGRVLNGECGPLKITEPKKLSVSSDISGFDLDLSFLRPVCFARRRIADNLFESEPWITGGSLKGSLATLLAADKTKWPNLLEHLHAIRFTHAFPTSAGEARPFYPPESLVRSRNGVRGDAIFDIEATMSGSVAPEFRVDWKQDADLWRAFKWLVLKHELRVRTSIDGESKRAGEGELFAYRMIVPNDTLTWRAQVLLNGVDKAARSAVATELTQALGYGLFAMGKTKAHASVAIRACEPSAASLDEEYVAVTLQTAALLCDPSRHLAPGGQIGSTGRDVMRKEYEDVWRDLSGGSLELNNYFHRQSLGGGGYFRHRFQSGKPYRPYLLTDAGSVFLLRIRESGRAKECVDRWLQRGIELSSAVRKFYMLTDVAERRLWEHCPFLPENGYGEIAVDLHKMAKAVWSV